MLNTPELPDARHRTRSLRVAVPHQTTNTMQKFKVKVVRVEYAVKEIEVEATSQEEANTLAEEKAVDAPHKSFEVYDVDFSVSDF